MKALATIIILLQACALPEGTLNDQEVITTVILQFGEAEFAFDDPDGDGGELPTIDPIVLAPGNYQLVVRFQNRLEDPPEEITEEVVDEADQHLLLFTGSAVVGPATANTTGPLQQTYADADANGLPIGLTNDVVVTPGEGMLTVTLRHMPPELPPEKSASTTAEARANGIDSIGGATDAQVSFSVVAQ
jgi:hypothetical protein